MDGIFTKNISQKTQRHELYGKEGNGGTYNLRAQVNPGLEHQVCWFEQEWPQTMCLSTRPLGRGTIRKCGHTCQRSVPLQRETAVRPVLKHTQCGTVSLCILQITMQNPTLSSFIQDHVCLDTAMIPAMMIMN